MAASVVRISIAPVKALGLVHPEDVELGPTGVEGDRRFWLLDAAGRLVNGKSFPQLMQVRPEWDESSRRLALWFPDGEVAEGVVDPGDPVEVSLWGEAHPSRAVDGPWAAALSEFVGASLTLLWSESGAADRGRNAGWMSLVSQASLARLGREAGEHRPVDGRRFRMLFEIDGVGPHQEDLWIGERVRIGGATVSPVGDVGRCAVTKCDPDTGASDLDTLGALSRYRREGRTEPLPLGVYGDVLVPGRVCVGDPVIPEVSVTVGQ
ncbi:MAG: MOSC domain-containing protein [Gaiellales bacterium]